MARLWPLLIRITFLLTGVVSLQAYAVQGKSNSSAAARKSAIRDFAEHLSGIPVEYQADLLFSLLYQEPNALSQQLQITLLTELSNERLQPRTKHRSLRQQCCEVPSPIREFWTRPLFP